MSVTVFTDHRTGERIEIDTRVWKLEGVIKGTRGSVIQLSNEAGDKWQPHVTEGELFILTTFYI